MSTKKVILLSYNPEEADNKPIEDWKDFHLFRTGDRTVLKNWTKNTRIVLYDTYRGLVAEFNLLNLINMEQKLNNEETKEFYRTVVKPPLYPFNSENFEDDIEINPLHLFYNQFMIYPQIIPIGDFEQEFDKKLRQQNGVIIDEDQYNHFLDKYFKK